MAQPDAWRQVRIWNLSHLTRPPGSRLSGRRIYPAIDVTQTSTRKEELLLSEFELSRSWILRRILNQMGVVEGMEFLMERMEGTSSNEEFLKAMND